MFISVPHKRSTYIDILDYTIVNFHLSSMLRNIEERIHRVEHVLNRGILQEQFVICELRVFTMVMICNEFEHCSPFSELTIVCQFQLIVRFLTIFADEFSILDDAAPLVFRQAWVTVRKDRVGRINMYICQRQLSKNLQLESFPQFINQSDISTTNFLGYFRILFICSHVMRTSQRFDFQIDIQLKWVKTSLRDVNIFTVFTVFNQIMLSFEKMDFDLNV